MQSIITLQKILKRYLGISLSILLLAFSVNSGNAQTTLTTTFANNNGFSLVTFNFTNNNPSAVIITGIASVCGTSGAMPVAAYVKTSAINGSPGAISAANGWNQFATATITAVANTTTSTPQTFFSGLSLAIPAGATYGIAVEAASLRYSTLAAGTFTSVGGGAVLTTGTNIGYAGAAAPAVPGNTPRGFIGSVTFMAAVPCTGTPAPGNTISTNSTGCAGTSFTLSPQNNTSGTGVTYQYQSSVTGTAGTFTNIPGAINSSYSGTVTSTMFYQVLVTCGGVTTASNPVQVALTPANQCYCTSSATSIDDEDIFNVTVGTLNNSSTCATTAPGPGSVKNMYSNYTSYTGAPAAPSLVQGANQPFSVSIGTCGGPYTNSVAIFIDLNQDGDFIDAGEKVYVSPAGTAGAHTLTGNLVIPVTATLGTTRMRVVNVETGAPGSITPCGTYLWGETEDYNVTIVPCVPLTITQQPANTSATCGGNATFTVTATGSAPSYQWQYRINAGSLWINITNTPPYSGANTAALTVTGVTAAMNGYQYRVIYSGACSGTDFSNVATLTINPIVAVVTPAAPSICVGGTQQLTITNISSPVPGSVTVNSTFTTPIAIPDAPAGSTIPYPAVVLAGINNTLNVTVPAGATVTGVSVRMSGTHSYFGDLAMSLKAPNNSVVNLDYFLNATGGGVSTAYSNTVITSNTAAAALSTGTAATLYTGTFRADLVPAAGLPAFGNQPGGPTAFLPTVTSFAPLFTPTTAANATGPWTLAIYDGGATDAGTLANWSITVSYVLGVPANGVFTGPVGTIFTDALATIPYTGTPINSVFVKPLAAGLNNYSVVVTDGGCSSNPLIIPVTVNAPLAGTPTLNNVNACVGSAGVFTVSGITGGTGLLYQLQVDSIGAPVLFTNVGAPSTSPIFSIPNTNLGQSGLQYRVIVSAAGCPGSVTSAPATFTVSPIPVVTISVAPVRNLFPGLTTTLTAAVSGATPPITYQWFRNGVAVPGATNNRLVVGIDGVGSYTVKATAGGCSNADSTTTPKTIVIGDSAGVTRLFIYPSPNSGQFQVRYFSDINNGSKSPAQVNVYDQKGARVFTRNYGLSSGYQPMNVDLGTHSRGIYRVELTDLNGERIKTGTVLVF